MKRLHPIVERLEAARIERGLSARRLSIKAGYSECHWGNVMRGDTPSPGIYMLSDFAEALGMRLELMA